MRRGKRRSIVKYHIWISWMYGIGVGYVTGVGSKLSSVVIFTLVDTGTGGQEGVWDDSSGGLTCKGWVFSVWDVSFINW